MFVVVIPVVVVVVAVAAAAAAAAAAKHDQFVLFDITPPLNIYIPLFSWTFVPSLDKSMPNNPRR